MSSPPDDMATQPAQTLPSFTQAFSSPTLNRLTSNNNVLPPIHRLASPNDRARHSPSGGGSPQQAADRKHNHRKRLHVESSPSEARDDGSGSDEHRSPRAVRIKEEVDHDPPAPTSTAIRAETVSKDARDSATMPSPSEAPLPPQKRRRVTISGGSNSINTNVASPASDSIKTMSPVIMGFTVRDDPQALEQMRSMLSVKQKQKELIEQRRGSTASIVSTAPPSVNIVNPPEHEDDRDARVPPAPVKVQAQALSQSTSAPNKPGGRSPNIPQSQPSSDRRRSVATSSASTPSKSHPPHPHPPHPAHPSHPSSSSMRHDSPGTLIAAHQQSQPQQLQPPPPRTENPTFVHTTTSTAAPHHTLPAPPISFANRRAGRQLGGAKGKPADIMINPRAIHPDNMPAIQSAPPIPRTDPTGRFGTMAVPSLPQISGPVHRHAASRVPPTPTRLTVARNPGPSNLGPGVAPGRSPPNASVPIASSLVPPTPATLHHPNYSNEKSAFLAPFELFYDALADSKQLKNWLAEQLQKSQALAASLQRQQEQLDELVEAAVEKRVGGMREDMYTLQQRVEELEQALRMRGPAPNQGYSPLAGPAALKGKAKANGLVASVAPDSYTFPPVDPHMRRPEAVRRAVSPSEYDSRSYPGSETASPAPFDVGRRLSVSAVRMAPRSPPEPPHARKPLAVHPTRERELSGPGYPPPPPPSVHPSGYARDRDREGRAPRTALSLSQSTSRGSVTHLHPSNEDSSPERRPAPYPYRVERRGSPGSGDERESTHPRREHAYHSPAGSRARSPMDES